MPDRSPARPAGPEAASDLTAVPVGYRWLAAAWIAYMSLVPVAWLPAVGTGTLRVVHGALLAVTVVGTFVAARQRSLPRGLAGPLGLAVVLGAGAFGVAQAVDVGEALSRIGVALVAFVILWSAFVWERNFGGLASMASWAAAVHGALGFVILASAVFGFALVAPSGVQGGSALEPTAVDAGFGLLRTYWSGGVALFVPFAVAAAMGSGRVAVRVVMAASVVGTFAGQIVVAGRAGLLVTLFAVVFMSAMRWGWKGLAGSSAGVAAAMALVLSRNADRLRFDRLFDASADGADFSSGRMTLNRFGMDRIAERPVRGDGFGVPLTELGGGSPLEIHNMWIRAGAEGGLVFLAALVVVVGNLVLVGVRTLRRVRGVVGRSGSMPVAAAVCTLVAGLIVSLFEPRFVLGHVHLTAIWWMAAGALVASSVGTQPD